MALRAQVTQELFVLGCLGREERASKGDVAPPYPHCCRDQADRSDSIHKQSHLRKT
jgi:hypothetical protein